MRKVTLVRGARQLLTLRGPSGPRRGTDLGNLGIIQDGAVLIADDVIVEVGPTRRLENLAVARGAQEIDASGLVVMPGFVDCNTQVMGQAVRTARSVQDLSPRVLKTLASRVVDEAIRSGTLAMEAKTGVGATDAAEMKALRVHAELRELPMTFVSTFLASEAVPGAWERMLPTVRRHKFADFAEIRWEKGTFTSTQVCRFLTSAREVRLGLKVGAGEHAHPDAIAMAVQMDATTVDDVEEVNERDANLLAQSATIAVLSPGMAFHRRAERSAPARMLIEHGAALALASGWRRESAPVSNMQTIIMLACREMNMTAAEAIVASTINGAYAIGRAGTIGSIEVGKSADLLILGVPDYRELPYHLGVNQVNLAMIRGTVLVERPEVQWPVR